MPGSVELPETVRSLLVSGGLDELGVVSCAAFDALAPESLRCGRQLEGAGCALVVGAGRELFRALSAGGADPLDRHTEEVMAQAVRALAEAGHPACAILGHVPGEDGHMDLVALGRAAGLGWPSRLGLLLHPQRGPWWSLRGVILTTLPLAPSAPLPGPGPCDGCPAPCTRACPSEAPQPDGFSISRCASIRCAPTPCAATCHARHACVLGQAYAYPSAAEAHLMAASRSALLEISNGDGARSLSPPRG